MTTSPLRMKSILTIVLLAMAGIASAQSYQVQMFHQGLKLVPADVPDAPAPPPAPARTYATWSPSDMGSSVGNSSLALDDSALVSSVTGWHSMGRATMGKSAGKWYWEVTINSGMNWPGIGVAYGSAGYGYLGSDAGGWSYCGTQTQDYQTYLMHGGSNPFGPAFGLRTGNTIGLALDMGAGTLTYFVNGANIGTPVAGLSGTVFPATSACDYGTVTMTANFGQKPFRFSVPSGFNPGVYSTP